MTIINDFNIILDKKQILKACGYTDSTIAQGESAYESALEAFYNNIDPVCGYKKIQTDDFYSFEFLSDDTDVAAVVAYTLGKAIEEIIHEAFAQGNYLTGLLLDAMAVNYLFQMGDLVAEQINYSLEVHSITSKFIPFDNIDGEYQEKIISLLPIGIRVNQNRMLLPVKSCTMVLAYGRGDLQCESTAHNCDNCNMKNCVYSKSLHRNATVKQNGGIGFAVDIGTTTIAVSLVNLESEEQIHTQTYLNPQRKFGLDVISRIVASGKGHLETMSNILVQSIREQIEQQLKTYNLEKTQIQKIVLTGNTVMAHLLLGRPCDALGQAPYTPVYDTFGRFRYKDIFHENDCDAKIYIPPFCSAFIGGDILCGAMYCNTLSQNYLLVDLGTNGEMIIRHGNKYLSTSTASGPAFEGIGVACGIGGINGAISNVDYRAGRFLVRTIGDKVPVGICGTGIIDTVSLLLEHGFMDKKGALTEAYFQQGVLLTAMGKREIRFTQQDIRQVQSAKGAIHAGIEILAEDIPYRELFVAGSFGEHLNIAHGCRMGLLPDDAPSIKQVGNSALKGAILLLTMDDEEAQMKEIVDNCTYINLSDHQKFQPYFIKHMDFM